MDKQQASELLRGYADQIPLVGTDRDLIFAALDGTVTENRREVLTHLVRCLPLKTQPYNEAMEAVRVLVETEDETKPASTKPVRRKRK